MSPLLSGPIGAVSYSPVSSVAEMQSLVDFEQPHNDVQAVLQVAVEHSIVAWN